MGCIGSKPPTVDAPVTPTAASPTVKAPATPAPTVSPPPVPPLRSPAPARMPGDAPLSPGAGSDWDATPRTPRPVTPASSDSDDYSDDDSDGEDDDRRCGRSAVRPDSEKVVGAASLKLGIGGSRGRCPPLHCTSCGFGVHRFAGHRWHRQIDYMHFRHFEGHSYDLAQLRAKLVVEAASAAYSCQCAWQSVSTWKALDQWGSDPAPEGGAANGRIEWRKVQRRGFNT